MTISEKNDGLEHNVSAEYPTKGDPPTSSSASLSSTAQVENPTDGKEDTSHILSGLSLNLLVFGLCISILLVALDNAILATAVPTITTQFNSLNDVGWYGAAFLICVCVCQLVCGKLYQLFSLKWSYMCFLALFEIGSLVCAVAPNSVALIVGRAIAGVGASGLFSGGMVIIVFCIPLNKRPIYTSLVMAMFSLANIIGPVLGGAFTQHVTWRWCFYINLPLGGVSAVILFFVFNPPERETTKQPLKDKIAHLDLPGFVIFAPGVVMMLLALNWGGTEYPWYSARIIGLLCGGGGLLILFAFWEWHQQDKASLSPKVLKQRAVYLGMPLSIVIFGALQTILYFVPIWFQAIRGESPTQSGVNLFPMVLGNVLMSISSGILVSKFGYFNPFLFLGSALVAIGAGLYTTWDVNTSTGHWVGFQILTGAGFGTMLQMPLVSVQASVPITQISVATSALAFSSYFGGSVFLAVASTVFRSELINNLQETNYSSDIGAIVGAGAQGFRDVVPAEDLGIVLEAYNNAVTRTFYIPLASALFVFLLSFGLKWVSVKKKNPTSNDKA